MKKILFCLTALLVMMASCSSDVLVDEEIVETTPTTETTTRTSMEKEYGNVRIKMYENIQGYDVKISNVKFYNMYGDIEPAFGTNLEGAVLSDDINKPTYDRANNSFTKIEAGTKLQVIISFDATLTLNKGGESIVNVNSAQILANQEMIEIEANKTYDLIVKIDADALNLEEIEFDADVEMYSDVDDVDEGGAIW